MTGLTKLAVAAALLLTGFAPMALAQERRDVPAYQVHGSAPACPNDAEEVAAFLETYWTAWGAQDVDTLRTLHADNTEWINAYARMFQTADSLADFLETRLFPAFDPAVSRDEVAGLGRISLRYAGRGVAIAHFYTDSARGPSQTAADALRRTHFHLVIERQDGGWRVVHTAIMDAR